MTLGTRCSVTFRRASARPSTVAGRPAAGPALLRAPLRRSLLGILAVSILGCGTGRSRRAESVPVEQLPLAADTLVVPFTNLPEVAWLGGRRWAVVGADHDAVVVADFGSKTVTPLGGPKNPELAKPFGVFAVGDTAFIADWGKTRTSIWSVDGKLVGAIPAPSQLRGILAKARDAAGQLYFEVPPIAGPDGSGLKDSAAVVRSDPGLTRFDSLARLAPLDIAEITEQRGKRYERYVFSGNDWWGVRPDGGLWIARVRLNRVVTVRDGKERRGEPLPDPVLDVTRADREHYLSTFPPELRSMAEKLPFAAIKPPFERALPGTEGEVWLRKSRPVRDSLRRYHVIDTAGMLSRVFTTIGNGVIAAVGRDAALITEQFRDGVRLMEVRIPAPPVPADSARRSGS